MSYHPSLEAILDTPEIRELKKQDLTIQRKVFTEAAIAAIEQIPVDNSVQTNNISFKNGSSIRHYTTDKASDIAVLFIHGGGWSLGSVDTYDHVCRYLCKNGGFQVFSLEYGLAPEQPFPIAVNQSLDAYDWLYDNANKYNFNKEKLYVMGDSAGGNFATIISNERQETMPNKQILVYPAVDMKTIYKSNSKYNKPKYHLTMDWCDLFLKAYLQNNEDLANPQVSPLFYENTKQPETFIIAATHDILIDGIYAYEKKLKSQGAKVTTHYDDEMFHGFMSTINISPLQNAKIALDKAIEFINK